MLEAWALTRRPAIGSNGVTAISISVTVDETDSAGLFCDVLPPDAGLSTQEATSEHVPPFAVEYAPSKGDEGVNGAVAFRS